MIITCPECDTRYRADAAKFPPAGRKVKCAKCGHTWHQAAPPPEPVVEAEEQIVRSPTPAPDPPEPTEVEEAPRPSAFAPDVHAETATHVPVITATPPVDRSAEPSLLAGRLGLVVGWGLLAGLVLIGAWAALTYRQEVATAWPQTASLYGALGKPVNPRGIDFTDLSYTPGKQDGQSVLAITGKLVNNSQREQPVSQIRAALFDANGRELYHWTFSAGITTLKPGKTAKFLTRISSPPAATKHLEVRFARAGE